MNRQFVLAILSSPSRRLTQLLKTSRLARSTSPVSGAAGALSAQGSAVVLAQWIGVFTEYDVVDEARVAAKSCYSDERTFWTLGIGLEGFERIRVHQRCILNLQGMGH